MHKNHLQFQVILVRIPVFGQFLRTQDEGALIPIFIVFYDTKRGEYLAKADAVREDVAVVLLKFIDDREQASR